MWKVLEKTIGILKGTGKGQIQQEGSQPLLNPQITSGLSQPSVEEQSVAGPSRRSPLKRPLNYQASFNEKSQKLNSIMNLLCEADYNLLIKNEQFYTQFQEAIELYCQIAQDKHRDKKTSKSHLVAAQNLKALIASNDPPQSPFKSKREELYHTILELQKSGAVKESGGYGLSDLYQLLKGYTTWFYWTQIVEQMTPECLFSKINDKYSNKKSSSVVTHSKPREGAPFSYTPSLITEDSSNRLESSLLTKGSHDEQVAREILDILAPFNPEHKIKPAKSRGEDQSEEVDYEFEGDQIKKIVRLRDNVAEVAAVAEVNIAYRKAYQAAKKYTKSSDIKDEMLHEWLNLYIQRYELKQEYPEHVSEHQRRDLLPLDGKTNQIKALIDQVRITNNEIEALKRTINTIEAENAEKIDKLKVDQQKALVNLEQKHNRTIDDLKLEHVGDLVVEKMDHDNNIEGLTRNYEEKIATIQAEHEKAIGTKDELIKGKNEKIKERTGEVNELLNGSNDLRDKLNNANDKVAELKKANKDLEERLERKDSGFWSRTSPSKSEGLFTTAARQQKASEANQDRKLPAPPSQTVPKF